MYVMYSILTGNVSCRSCNYKIIYLAVFGMWIVVLWNAMGFVIQRKVCGQKGAHEKCRNISDNSRKEVLYNYVYAICVITTVSIIGFETQMGVA